MNLFTNGILILKIYFACSFADAMFSSGNSGETSSASHLSHMHRALSRANPQISVLCAFTTHPKVALVSSGNRKGLFLFVTNDKIHNFERLSIFPKCPIDFHDFWNKYSRAITVGMYALEFTLPYIWKILLKMSKGVHRKPCQFFFSKSEGGCLSVIAAKVTELIPMHEILFSYQQ